MHRFGFALIAASLAAGASASTSVYNANISEAEVVAAQTAWCNALVAINKAGEDRGHAAAKQLASDVLDAAYGYNLGPVLFKPTLAAPPQTFRTTREGALAYFVGGDPNFAQDSGFALKGWTACRAENAAIHINGDVATSMGNVSITNKDGKVTTVDKTWTFKKSDDGRLRIVVHHSSLPYSTP
jgi:hypothetical protein